MRVPGRLVSALRKEERYLIATHISPDGDALGSSLALAEALSSIGKKVVLYDRDPVPRNYQFLPGWKKFSADLKKALRDDPVLVILDCNGPERAALEGISFRKTIVIDHHETERNFGDLRWVEKEAAATGIMIHALIKSLGIGITPSMAGSLYTAIAVDTGTFRFSNTSAPVLRAAAELVTAGAEPNAIAEYLYETWDSRRFRLFVMAMNTMERIDGVAIIHVTSDMFSESGASAEDTENFANLPRRIDDVRIAAMFRQTGPGEWKASLRSKGTVNVARIAEQFGGGGHKNAAGFRIKADLATAKRLLRDAVRKTRRSDKG
ncbi:MAG: bifunctional oligoribonuclease/PAP phosphatase NrnA [Nitrospiraceae bacterium]|nr:bifunctional oligoribonuclease/PAP phosphatase NrnA [Nitrospiraceae bacterium]